MSTYPALTAELLKRAYSDADMKKVLGQNVLRVMKRAEEVAARYATSVALADREWCRLMEIVRDETCLAGVNAKLKVTSWLLPAISWVRCSRVMSS